MNMKADHSPNEKKKNVSKNTSKISESKEISLSLTINQSQSLGIEEQNQKENKCIPPTCLRIEENTLESLDQTKAS